MSQFDFYPQAAVWEITFACNMRCLHCGTSAGKARPDELTTDEALALIDTLAEMRCEAVTLSGGEPLLRKDWRELAKRVKHHDMMLFLITNGMAVDTLIARDVAELRFDNAGISFDGTREIHNYIRQNPQSYDRVIEAMRHFKEAHVPFCAVSQVSSINIGELDKMRAILKEAGCTIWRIQMTTTTGRMRPELTLPVSEYPRLLDKLTEFKAYADMDIDVGENIGYYGFQGTKLWNDKPYLGCYAGMRVVGIESNGNIKGCLSMPEDFVEGNIREKSLQEIWNAPDAFAYNRRFTREHAEGACHDCRYLPLCRGGCATTSVSASGCRANNPYCIYQMELKKGIEPQDTEQIRQLLSRFEEPVETAG